ncbi:MAG TPA: bis(5'-nucleosyl)-tetraphosphatase (symmetrical) YqeK [Limnochordales bacterium]
MAEATRRPEAGAAPAWEAAGVAAPEAAWDELASVVREQVSRQRWEHIQGVVQTARELARRFRQPEQPAALAALLHDVARDWPAQRLQQAVREAGWAVDPLERAIPELLHGPAAAAWASAAGWCRTGEVLQAIRYHTTGRPQAGPLEMVLMVADFLEPGREHEAARRLRAAQAQGGEPAATLRGLWQRVLEERLRWLVDSGLPIHPRTVAALNWVRWRH